MIYNPIPQEFMQHYVRHSLENQSNLNNNNINNDSDNNNGHHQHNHHEGGGGGNGHGNIKSERDKDEKGSPRRRLKVAEQDIKEEDQGESPVCVQSCHWGLDFGASVHNRGISTHCNFEKIES